MTNPRARIVESIPLDLYDLGGAARATQTGAVLAQMIRAAERTIDLTAMYWSLLNDEGEDPPLTSQQYEKLGVEEGRDVYDALLAAATRGVKIRILQGPGFSPGTPQESDVLASKSPNFEIETVSMPDFYLDGVMHQKFWVFDGRHLYLGSANMDWRSFTQVKELGVVVEDCPELAADLTKYFEVWWTFGTMKPSPENIAVARDQAAQIWRRVPRWSELVPPPERAPSPFDADGYATSHNLEHPLEVELNGHTAGVFVSGCPREVTGRGRTFDGDALVHTIRDAARSVCVNVMDFVPLSLYYRHGDAELAQRQPEALLDAPIWWPDLMDELLHAALTRRVWVRLLVSKWAQTSPLIEPYLRALKAAADAGRASPSQTGGLLEIKRFIMPGWDETGGSSPKYAPSSRVNHAKFIVTDRRVNVGTSNMSWDYFSNTAGSSFNSDHPGLVRDLQAIFDRDWTSRYAVALTSA